MNISWKSKLLILFFALFGMHDACWGRDFIIYEKGQHNWLFGRLEIKNDELQTPILYDQIWYQIKIYVYAKIQQQNLEGKSGVIINGQIPTSESKNLKIQVNLPEQPTGQPNDVYAHISYTDKVHVKTTLPNGLYQWCAVLPQPNNTTIEDTGDGVGVYRPHPFTSIRYKFEPKQKTFNKEQGSAPQDPNLQGSPDIWSPSGYEKHPWENILKKKAFSIFSINPSSSLQDRIYQTLTKPQFSPQVDFTPSNLPTEFKPFAIDSNDTRLQSCYIDFFGYTALKTLDKNFFKKGWNDYLKVKNTINNFEYFFSTREEATKKNFLQQIKQSGAAGEYYHPTYSSTDPNTTGALNFGVLKNYISNLQPPNLYHQGFFRIIGNESIQEFVRKHYDWCNQGVAIISASTHTSFEGGMGAPWEILNNMQGSAVQGETVATMLMAASIWRKYGVHNPELKINQQRQITGEGINLLEHTGCEADPNTNFVTYLPGPNQQQHPQQFTQDQVKIAYIKDAKVFFESDPSDTKPFQYLIPWQDEKNPLFVDQIAAYAIPICWGNQAQNQPQENFGKDYNPYHLPEAGNKGFLISKTTKKHLGRGIINKVDPNLGTDTTWMADVAKGILKATTQASIMSAVLNNRQKLVMTAIGTSAFANPHEWFIDAVHEMKNFIAKNNMQIVLLLPNSARNLDAKNNLCNAYTSQDNSSSAQKYVWLAQEIDQAIKNQHTQVPIDNHAPPNNFIAEKEPQAKLVDQPQQPFPSQAWNAPPSGPQAPPPGSLQQKITALEETKNRIEINLGILGDQIVKRLGEIDRLRQILQIGKYAQKQAIPQVPPPPQQPPKVAPQPPQKIVPPPAVPAPILHQPSVAPPVAPTPQAEIKEFSLALGQELADVKIPGVPKHEKPIDKFIPDELQARLLFPEIDAPIVRDLLIKSHRTAKEIIDITKLDLAPADKSSKIAKKFEKLADLLVHAKAFEPAIVALENVVKCYKGENCDQAHNLMKLGKFEEANNTYKETWFQETTTGWIEALKNFDQWQKSSPFSNLEEQAKSFVSEGQKFYTQRMRSGGSSSFILEDKLITGRSKQAVLNSLKAALLYENLAQQEKQNKNAHLNTARKLYLLVSDIFLRNEIYGEHIEYEKKVLEITKQLPKNTLLPSWPVAYTYAYEELSLNQDLSRHPLNPNIPPENLHAVMKWVKNLKPQHRCSIETLKSILQSDSLFSTYFLNNFGSFLLKTKSIETIPPFFIEMISRHVLVQNVCLENNIDPVTLRRYIQNSTLIVLEIKIKEKLSTLTPGDYTPAWATCIEKIDSKLITQANVILENLEKQNDFKVVKKIINIIINNLIESMEGGGGKAAEFDKVIGTHVNVFSILGPHSSAQYGNISIIFKNSFLQESDSFLLPCAASVFYNSNFGTTIDRPWVKEEKWNESTPLKFNRSKIFPRIAGYGGWETAARDLMARTAVKNNKDVATVTLDEVREYLREEDSHHLIECHLRNDQWIEQLVKSAAVNLSSNVEKIVMSNEVFEILNKSLDQIIKESIKYYREKGILEVANGSSLALELANTFTDPLG